MEEIEDTKQESKNQAEAADEARLELSIHQRSHGVAQQAIDRVMQGTELVSQENNEMLLDKLNMLRKAIHQCTGHTMNKIQAKKNIDVSKVCNILQDMTTQLDMETAKAITSDQCEGPVDYARIAERQTGALRGIQEFMFTQGSNTEQAFRNGIKEEIPWMEAITAAFGAPMDFQMGDAITQSAIGDKGRRMVRDIAKETEVDGGHRQRINDLLTGLDKTAALVHELAQAALESTGREQDNQEITDKSGSLLKEVSKTRDRVYVEESEGHRNSWFKRAAGVTILQNERDKKTSDFRKHNEQEMLKLEARIEVSQAQVKSLRHANQTPQERHVVTTEAKEEAIEKLIQEQHKTSTKLASEECTIQKLETTIEEQRLKMATDEKEWNDTQYILNAASMSADQNTLNDESFTAQEMESSTTASVNSQLSRLIQMQEANNTAESRHVKELQRELNIETDRQVNAESQLEAARQDYISATTEELTSSCREFNESQNMHTTMEQKVVLLGQEAKSDLSAEEEAVARLEAQLEVELDKLTAKDKCCLNPRSRTKTN